jgi:hypothetical protein
MRMVRFVFAVWMLSLASFACAAGEGAKMPAASAEQAAIAFVEGLIAKDGVKVRSACLKQNGNERYSDAFSDFVVKVESAASESSPQPGAPKSIKNVFAARQLSSSGPASYGYAAFDFRNVVFVDVVILRNDGKEQVYRILVVKDAKSAWFVHPLPEISPLLSSGLWDESPSVIEFKGESQGLSG